MSKDTKSKGKNSRRKSVEAVQMHEPLIQDRIAGMAIKDLAQKYGMHRDSVSAICSDNKERIEAEVTKRMQDRREAINQALHADVERMVNLMTRTSTLLEKMVDAVVGTIEKHLDAIENDPDSLGTMKPGTLFKGLEAATTAFHQVRSSALAQQKQASSE